MTSRREFLRAGAVGLSGLYCGASTRRLRAEPSSEKSGVEKFGDAVVFLFLGSVGALGLLLVLALMPETREAPAATLP